MRQSWAHALSVEAETDDGASAIDLDQVRAETPVDALPFSARARNALDRAGVSTVTELLQLPRNQISVVRGVGTRVAQEIFELAEKLHARFAIESRPPFVPGFARPRLPLEDPEAGLDPSTADRLIAAGLKTTVDAALAPAGRIEKLLGLPRADVLRERLGAMAAAEPSPGSLADWARELIGRASVNEANRRIRVLSGLDPLPDERPDTGLPASRTVVEVAGAFGIEPAQIHASLQFLRTKRWTADSAAAALRDGLSSALDAAGPALPFADLAEALARARTEGEPTADDLRTAAALVRVALELRPDPPATWRRIGATPWIARDAEVLDALAALAETADRLAGTEPLPSSEVVRAALAEVSASTPLAALPADQRLGLAARASETAAASARLELYPRGMDGGRALALSLSALAGVGLTADVVRKRIATRYPEAAPLPDRPALDALLAPHGLVFLPDLGAGEYARPGQHAQTSMTAVLPPRKPAAPGLVPRRSPEAQRAAAFQDQLDRGVAAGRFRVVQVRADLAGPATDALALALKTQAVSLDQALSAAVRQTAVELGVAWANIEAADRAGAGGPDWPLLTELVRQATDRVVDELLARPVPTLLLAWPGAFARYGLAGALLRIVDGAERGMRRPFCWWCLRMRTARRRRSTVGCRCLRRSRASGWSCRMRGFPVPTAPWRRPDMRQENLPKLLQPALKALEKDLLARTKAERVEAGLRTTWADEQKAGQTGSGFEPWRRERVTQLAVAWILSIVFVRTLEDRGYIAPRIAGATPEALRAAEDREQQYITIAPSPSLGSRGYVLAVFRELSKLPGARDVFDARHNPVWVLAPSSEGVKGLLDFFRKRDASGAPALVFTGGDTRFLGDLYQDLSEAVRKRYALLQTPEFVEEFILDQTLDPAIAEFGLGEVTLIDPTCGSGHFLLGAFRRLLGRWQAETPMVAVEDLARRALDQVYGVDINPYAVAIARFRLVLAVLDAVGIKRLERAPNLRPNVVVADSLLHRFDQGVLGVGQTSMADDQRWGDRLFRLENRADVERVLTKRFHAVVGNPPFITEKDASKRKKYREMYESAAGKYALAAPFTERFFDLGVEGGFVGLINSNAWTKRDYGKTLIEKVLPRLDLQKVIDTSGCYLPGHGTPTLLLFGRNRLSSQADVTAVLGKRGECEVPADPPTAPVWSQIVAHHQHRGFDGTHVSVEAFVPTESRHHPWVITGGGARSLFGHIRARSDDKLKELVDTIGFMAITACDDAFVRPICTWKRAAVDDGWLRVRYTGTGVRDWALDSDLGIAFAYGSGQLASESDASRYLGPSLWPQRRVLLDRPDFGGKRYIDVGRTYFEYHQIPVERLRRKQHIAFACVSTHNNFVLARSGALFDRHAPIITLRQQYTESDHQALLGYLNSSTVAFWCRLVMFPKGGDQVGEGARLSKTPWQDRLEYAGNLLQQLPVPKLEDLRERLLDLVIAAEETVRQMAEQAPSNTVAKTLATTPTLAALRESRTHSLAERARLHGILISLQEEMDWRVYGLFGLPTLTAPTLEAVRIPVEPNHRPFEVRLARDVATDISASEWFRVHKREAPNDVGGPLADLYRQRLRLLDHPDHGKSLRLLETPETKRRWSPPDDAKAFSEAVRTWLLERIETAFRDQSAPELRSARQLALELGREPAVQAAHALLTEESGLDLVKLFSDLVDTEGVPFLAGYRYAETGTEKRATWEETWRLQRLEDAGTLAPELTRLGLTAIPVPDKYGPKDFLRHFWSLRGKLDVPKERFIAYPSARGRGPTPRRCSAGPAGTTSRWRRRSPASTSAARRRMAGRNRASCRCSPASRSACPGSSSGTTSRRRPSAG